MINCKLAQDKGLCRGDCCGMISFEEDFFKANLHKAQQPIIMLKEVGNEVIPITDDYKCVFLGTDYKCAIYEDRPEVCRLFGYMPNLVCPYCKINGGINSPAKIKHYQRKINHRVDECMRRYRGQLILTDSKLIVNR